MICSLNMLTMNSIMGNSPTLLPACKITTGYGLRYLVSTNSQGISQVLRTRYHQSEQHYPIQSYL